MLGIGTSELFILFVLLVPVVLVVRLLRRRARTVQAPGTTIQINNLVQPPRSSAPGFCTRCGTPQGETDRFCARCGAPRSREA